MSDASGWSSLCCPISSLHSCLPNLSLCGCSSCAGDARHSFLLSALVHVSVDTVEFLWGSKWDAKRQRRTQLVGAGCTSEGQIVCGRGEVIAHEQIMLTCGGVACRRKHDSEEVHHRQECPHWQQLQDHQQCQRAGGQQGGGWLCHQGWHHCGHQGNCFP